MTVREVVDPYTVIADDEHGADAAYVVAVVPGWVSVEPMTPGVTIERVYASGANAAAEKALDRIREQWAAAEG